MDEDGQSSSTSTTPNSSSSYEYSHEPYETFQSKVISLAHSLDDVDDIALQRTRGGSYNRVVIVKLWQGEHSVTGVFRIPRFPNLSLERDEDDAGTTRQIDKEIQDQAAVLQFLASRDLSAPKLLAFDASAANAIGSPFVFQEYSSGIPLHNVYEKMAVEAKLSITDSLLSFLLNAEQTRFSAIGPLRAVQRTSAAVKGSYIFEPAQVPLEMGVGAFETDLEGQYPYEPPSTSTLDFFAKQLGAWYAQERQFKKSTNPVVEMWRRLVHVLLEMQALDYFQSQRGSPGQLPVSILYHWDLEPRNILVRPRNGLESEHAQETGEWEIDKVIDWDRILAVPPVLARKPPVWLWDFSYDSEHPSITSDFDGDVDHFTSSRYDIDSGRLSPDDQRIRQHFEENLILGLRNHYEGYDRASYLEEAYGKGRWLRRLARFAIHGASDNQDLERFHAFDREWSALHASTL